MTVDREDQLDGLKHIGRIVAQALELMRGSAEPGMTTAELDASISYNFEDPTNNLTKRLKNLIVGTTEKEATSILLNDGNVAGVKLRFSPFWLTRVSSNPDSIEFIIEK